MRYKYTEETVIIDQELFIGVNITQLARITGYNRSVLTDVKNEKRVASLNMYITLKKAIVDFEYKPRRIKASNHIQKSSVRKRVMDKCDNQCSLCGDAENLCVDHIKSVRNGGGNEDENLRILCRRCNSSKGGRN